MNKKEINGITNPVLRSTVIAGVHAKQRSSITVSACFSKLSSLESTPFVEIVRLNRNAVSDAYPDDSIHPQVEHSAEPITPFSSFAISRCVQKGKKGDEQKEGEEEFDGRIGSIPLFLRSFLSLR